MAGRIRTIKPEILSDAKAARLSDRAWRLWVSMWTLADDCGLCPSDPDFLGARVFWGTGNVDARAPLTELVRGGFVSLYVAQGEHFAKINGWSRHQKIDKPSGARFPEPPKEFPVLEEVSRAFANPREDSSRDHDLRPPITTSTTTVPYGEASPPPAEQGAFDLATQEPPRPKKPPAPEVAEAITYFQRRWVELRSPTDGQRPTMTDADKGQLIRLLKAHGLEATKGFLERYLTDEDAFLVTNGHALKHLPSRLDGYRTSSGAGKRGNTAPGTFDKGGDLTSEYT